MAGLVPAIHVFPASKEKSWKPGTSPQLNPSFLMAGLVV
jgi:hypothetical protein